MAKAMMDALVPKPIPVPGGSQFCTDNNLLAPCRKRARRGQFWSRLTGRSRALYALKDVRAACTLKAEFDGGIRSVPIRQIRGSEGRSRYFDCDFNPLYDQARGRWLNIARARQEGKALPPVVLVQVGDVYFVRDGHHRISVARALGQLDIEAEVTVWQVSGRLPWDAHVEPSRPGLVDRLLGLGHAFTRRWLQGLVGSARSALGPMTANRLAEGEGEVSRAW
jgi:hypothetical protein